MPDTESLTSRSVFAKRLSWWLLLAVCSPCGSAPAAEETAPTMWKTGQELERQLETAVGITWAGNPLRHAVGNLARSQQVAIFLDRRVDPDQEVQFSVNDVALRQVLQRLAAELKLGICRVGPVSYLGPKSAADALGTLAAIKDEQSRSLPVDVRGRLARTKPLRWAELSTPRELLGQVTQEAGFRLAGLEQVPHDLWPAVDLPSLTLTQRLSLLLSGFDLTFEVSEDGRTIQLTPLPTNRVFERSYTVTSQHASELEQLARRFPQASLTREPGKVLVAGTLEVHEAVRELLTPKRPVPPPRTKPTGKADSTWTLKVENKPIGAVAKTIATRLQCQLEYDPQLRSKLEQLVSLDLKNVTLEELLHAALSRAGLTYQLEEKVLRIIPSDSAP